MYTLGLNAAFSDPAACLVHDGKVVAAAEEERFTRVRHGKRPLPFAAWELPFHAIDYCLAQAGLVLRDVDHVAYSFDPRLVLERGAEETAMSLPMRPGQVQPRQPWGSSWDPLFLCHVINAPLQLVDGVPLHLRSRFRGAGPDSFQWHFVARHLAHAAGAFHASPYGSAAVLVLDARGELATTSYAAGEGASLKFLGEVRMPHSLGALYEQVAAHLGFLPAADEHKVAALAALGAPRHADAFREIVRLGADGRYTIDDPRLEERFGPARRPDEALDSRHMDVARSVQQVLEETVVEIGAWLRERTRERRLCVAGSAALQCALASRLEKGAGFSRVWAQPAPGDAGTALGAALWVDSTARGGGRRGPPVESAALGPESSDDEIETLLCRAMLSYRRTADPAEEAAALLASGRVVGWFQGRMEFGPRGLGQRSILASPAEAIVQARVNELKEREEFRPLGAAVLEEEAAEWFVGARPSPFMHFACDVRPDKESLIPAVRRADGTARLMTVNRQLNAPFHSLLKAFQRRSGLPLLATASLSARGAPIARSPREALELFWTTSLDALVAGSFVLEKAPSAALRGGGPAAGSFARR